MSDKRVLALNCGSSSVKLALLDPVSGVRSVEGLAERLGTPDATVQLSRHDAHEEVIASDDATHHSVVAAMIGALTESERRSVAAIGHRIVHGGSRFTESVRIDDNVLKGLADVTHLAPLHTPGTSRTSSPCAPRCRGARCRRLRYCVPPHAAATCPSLRGPAVVIRGSRRPQFGFHGISHRYVATRASELLGRDLERLRVVPSTSATDAAHAPSAMVNPSTRRSVSGRWRAYVMGTRSGDIEFRTLSYVGRRLALASTGVISERTNASGLQGLAGISPDIRNLVAAAERDSADAALAVDVFCYRAAKSIYAIATASTGSMRWFLPEGSVSTLPVVRSKIMSHLTVMGVAEDPPANWPWRSRSPRTSRAP